MAVDLNYIYYFELDLDTIYEAVNNSDSLDNIDISIVDIILWSESTETTNYSLI